MSLPQQFGSVIIGTFLAATAGAQINVQVAADRVRPADCAGSWYPARSAELTRQVDGLLSKAEALPLSSKPLAIISPHAGYRYSAGVAAAAYRTLQEQRYRRVIVLAFSHQRGSSYRGVDVPGDLQAYHTPLGDVPIDRPACDRLLQAPGISAHPGMDRGEHSLELQLPFLQRVLGTFQLVPVLVGRMSAEDHAQVAQALLPLLDAETLLVASSDFTHFGPRFGYTPFHEDVPARLKALADDAAAPILKCDFDGFADHLAATQDTICGRAPILLLLRTLAMRRSAQGIRAAFDTSGHITGDWANSVTYQSFVFVPRPGRFNSAERRALLQIARNTVTAHLTGQPTAAPEAVQNMPALQAPGACFVTLKNRGNLRGCIGNFEANSPLIQAVTRNAVSACQDPRFTRQPVTAAELKDVNIEISCLTPLKPVSNHSDIVIGRHGLLIVLGQYRGVLLPQVAYERGWTRQQFLAQTCRKANLPADAWKNKDAILYSFEAEVFGEPES